MQRKNLNLEQVVLKEEKLCRLHTQQLKTKKNYKMQAKKEYACVTAKIEYICILCRSFMLTSSGCHDEEEKDCWKRQEYLQIVTLTHQHINVQLHLALRLH